MSRPPLVLPALLLLVTAASAGRLPSTLQLDQLERTRLDEPRLERPHLGDRPRLGDRPLDAAEMDEARRLVQPRLEDEDEEQPVLVEPPRRPWSAGRRGHRRDEAEREQQGGSSSERLGRSRHRKRKRPSAEHLMFLRSRDSTCPRSASGEEQFFCASQYPSGERACVSLSSLCDGVPDCPGGEDELAVGCLFYNALSRNLEKMTDKVLQLTAHHRNRLR